MALALPVADRKTASRTLVRAYLDLEAARPDPGGAPPGLIVALPPAFANKYQVLLYGTAAERRWSVVGATGPEDLARISWPGPVVLHAHWFAPLFRGARGELQAGRRLRAVQAAIERFRDRTGAKLLWTAHNVFPHGNAFPETFLALRRWIFETFDAVHVMDAAHVPVLEQAFDRPAPRVIDVPHMTYEGAVLDHVSPAVARAQLGLPDGALVFGLFGSLQGYKRIELFLEAFDRVAAAAARPVAAVVGGIPGEDGTAARLALRWGGDPRIRLLPRKIGDPEIQYLHRAADVMVLPYAETLNSGAALMAATFRRPVLMPAGHAADGLEGLGVTSYDETGPDGLVQAMAACVEAGAPGRADPAAFAARHPSAVSRAFLDALDALAGRD